MRYYLPNIFAAMLLAAAALVSGFAAVDAPLGQDPSAAPVDRAAPEYFPDRFRDVTPTDESPLPPTF